MSFASSTPPPPHESLGSSPQVHTSIDLGCFDTLVNQHHDSGDRDSLSFAFSPPVESSFRVMEPQNQYQTQREIHHRMNRATTLSIPSPNASFPSAHSVASSASFAFSSNSILMNSLGSSPGAGELDFTGVPYVENNTPVGPPAMKTAPSPRRRRSQLASGVRSPSFAQETRLMDRERLTQLRNYLIRSSQVDTDNIPSPRHVDGTLSNSRQESMDGEYEDGEESSFVGMLPPPELIRARSGPRYIEAAGRASSAPTEVSMLSSTNTLPGELLGVMPLPTPSRIPQHAPPRTTNSHAMPRESVAVLIDAVRASTLPEDEKCRFIFDHFDVTKRGVLSREGVTAFVEATLVANNMHCYGDFNVSKMVDKLFEGKQQMTYSEFRAAFGHAIFKSTPTSHTSGQPVKPAAPRPTGRVTESTQRHEEEGGDHRTLRQLDDTPRMSDCSPPLHFRQSSVGSKKQSKVLRNYRKYQDEIHWMVFYTLVLVAAFAVKASRVPYDPAVGVSAKVAKGFAQVIMVDALFLLLPMCRNLVTYLRKFASITSHVPVDRNIDFHKICGVVMLLAALGHTVAWVMIIHYLRSVPDELWQQSKYSRLAFLRDETAMQLAQRLPIWTGFLMLLIAAVAAPLTHPAIRRGNFNAFWLTHLMFVPFLLLILAHGMAMWVQPPQAFYWILPPCLLYFADKRYRMSKIFGGKTSIQRVHFSQDTVAVFMKKPAKFDFHPSMYLYLNVPAISRFEWHPFTISSAPEDDCLSVHIRKAGDWTGALHALLKTAKDRNEGAAGGGGADLEVGSPYPPVYIDGPVGAPSQEYYRYKSVVFVGAGIGVTPFASILRSIVHQWQAFRCPCCESVTFPREFQIQKIYFYWITREQESLTWFTETMNQLSALDTKGRLEIHNYFSPLKNEVVTAPLRALQTFMHEAEGQDIISGLATKQVTHFGRPKWKQELQRIAQKQQERTLLDQQLELEQLERQEGNGQLTSRLNLRVARLKQHEKPPVEDVAVFFCGPKPMGSEIHDECAKFNQDRTRTSSSVAFDFHSEVF